jgi:hypothetical protein
MKNKGPFDHHIKLIESILKDLENAQKEIEKRESTLFSKICKQINRIPTIDKLFK